MILSQICEYAYFSNPLPAHANAHIQANSHIRRSPYHQAGNPGRAFIRVALVAPEDETEQGLTRIRDCLYER